MASWVRIRAFVAFGGLASLVFGASSFMAQSESRSGSGSDLSEKSRLDTAEIDSPAIPTGHVGPGPLHKVWAEGPQRDSTLARLSSAGALLRVHDYGAFALAIVDDRPLGGGAKLVEQGFDVRDEMDLMVFNEIQVDGRAPQAALASLPPDLRLSSPTSASLDPLAGLYVVQFEGPPHAEWLVALDLLGATFRQYVPMNAFVLALPPERVTALESFALASDFVQFVGVYEPAFKVHRDLREAWLAFDPTQRLVTIQLVDGPGVSAQIDSIQGLAERVVSQRRVGPYVNLRAVMHPAFLWTLAVSPHVFQIEPQGELVRLDERQGQIVAGNVTATSPSAPGYLAWLSGLGFDASQFSGFSVNVADDSTSLTGHPDLASTRVAFALNPTSQSGAQGGHGFLNAHIIAGINTGTGTAVEDGAGFNYGLGIAPWARVGSTAIFGSGTFDPPAYESQAYGLGARISSNSWGFQTFAGGPVADYDVNSQEFDFVVRDAQGGTAGNQQYSVVFSAGNNGSSTNTVTTPATAKNVITVGAAENDRQTGTDGCGIGNSGANSWQDIISFSSRGPVNSSGGDGRWKPEIVAPGTHIQAGVPQSNYDGSGVCNQYWPSGQTLYGWSSGTSHSCPAVAGGAALVYQWFLNNSLAAPSPAMVKAVLVGSGTYMTGTGANDTLPSNNQGTGTLNLPRAVGAAGRVLLDQSVVFGATGQTHTLSGNVVDTSKPFRVALVWTDAPGPTSGAPYVNNLDLSVTVGGTAYRGNVFSGASSIAGGSADARNNTELVFLPAGTSGSFSVTVTATSIGGDGVPGNGDSSDQDFALLVYNGSEGVPTAPTANFTGTPTSGTAPLTVAFSDASTGSISGWSWDFGDGNGSTAQNPSHVYSAAGTYSVTLTVTGPGGSDDLTRTDYVTVSAPVPPTASFSGTPISGNAPLTVNFTDLSTGSITSWLWDFGDGGTSTAQNPSRVYSAAGTYDVTLTVSGPAGSNTLVRTGYISVLAGSGPFYYMSFDVSTSVPGVGTVADEDIVRYDAGSGTWSLYFDGSDVGYTADTDAFHVRSNGSILLSFSDTSASVSGLGTVEDSDVVLFTPTSTGATTAGTFAWYFDGSDVGLTTSAEDVDGLLEFADGSLGISTLGDPGVTGLSGLTDEDVIRFTGTFGATTSGSWSWHFDGSDVGFSTSTSEDLDAIALSDSDLLFSTLGSFSASGASGTFQDVGRFTGTFGSATSGTASIQLALASLGIPTTSNLDGLSRLP